MEKPKQEQIELGIISSTYACATPHEKSEARRPFYFLASSLAVSLGGTGAPVRHVTVSRRATGCRESSTNPKG